MSNDAVGWVTSLDSSERRLLGAFRSAAFALQDSDGAFGAALQADLEAALGTAWWRAIAPSFRALMLTLGQHARRDIRFHVPACPCIGADEALLMRLHAKFASGPTDEAHALAHCLVEDAAVPALLHHASALAKHGPAPASARTPAPVAARGAPHGAGGRPH